MAKTSTERTRAYRQARRNGEISETQLTIWLSAKAARRLDEIALRDGIAKRHVVERFLEAA